MNVCNSSDKYKKIIFMAAAALSFFVFWYYVTGNKQKWIALQPDKKLNNKWTLPQRHENKYLN